MQPAVYGISFVASRFLTSAGSVFNLFINRVFNSINYLFTATKKRNTRF